jgi:hypothetical protein
MNTKIVHTANIWLTAMTLTIIARLNPAADSTSTDDDRGDVPGWVMITVMTAIVVIALLGVFRTQVTEAVTNAFTSVRNGG